MYNYNQPERTSIDRNESYEGERIEQKIERILTAKEPITDGAPLIYTDRKDGVQPQYDIRTDRFEIAVEAMDKVTKSQLARRDLAIGDRTFDTMTDEQQKAHLEKYPNSKHKKAPKTDTTTGENQ